MSDASCGYKQLQDFKDNHRRTSAAHHYLDVAMPVVVQQSWDFYMGCIRSGNAADIDRVINRFRSRNTTTAELVGFLRSRDECGLTPLHWAAYNTESAHNAIIALVSPIAELDANNHLLYDILALRVIQTPSTPTDIREGMNMFQINLQRGGTEAFDVIHKYHVPGIEDIYFNSENNTQPVLCLAAAQCLNHVQAVLGNTDQLHPPSSVHLINSSRTQEERWTSLHMAVVHEVPEAKEIISFLLSKFDDEEEKLKFLRMVDQDNLTGLRSTTLIDSSEKAAAILDSLPGDIKTIMIEDPDRRPEDPDRRPEDKFHWNLLHLCALNDSTKILTDLKTRLDDEGWCDMVLARNNENETPLHIALNSNLPGTILLLTEFLGERRNEVPETIQNNVLAANQPNSQLLSRILLSSKHSSALLFAASDGDENLVRQLLLGMPPAQLESYVKLTDQFGDNFLHHISQCCCTYQGQANIIQLLGALYRRRSLSKNTLLELLTQPDNAGLSPCHKAVQHGNMGFILSMIEQLDDLEDVNWVLRKQTNDELGIRDLISEDDSITRRKLNVLLEILDVGTEKALDKFDTDLQKCFTICEGVTNEFLLEHIRDAPTEYTQAEQGYIQQDRLHCAAMALRVRKWREAEEFIMKALTGPDHLHIYSNMCRLRLAQGKEIEALMSAYHLFRKQDDHELRLQAKSDFAFLLTNLGDWSDLHRANAIHENILNDPMFESVPTSTKLVIMATFAMILPRVPRRVKRMAPEQKTTLLNRANEVLNNMQELISDPGDNYYYWYHAICHIWKCDIATQKRDVQFTYLDHLRRAKASVDRIDRDYYLPARIGKICNWVCYNAFDNIPAGDLEECYKLGSECCDISLECGLAANTGFQKMMSLLFLDASELYHHSGEARDDFRKCVLHNHNQKDLSTQTGRKSFMDHIRYHYRGSYGDNQTKQIAILREARDLADEMNTKYQNRVFFHNLSVLIKLKFRLGESADSLERFVEGHILNQNDRAQIKCDLGWSHQHEYEMYGNRASLNRARALYQEAVDLNNFWVARTLLNSIPQ